MAVRVNEEAGRKLLRNAGFKDLSASKVRSRLRKLNEYDRADLEELKEPDDKRLYREIVGALERGEEVVVEDGGAPPAGTNGGHHGKAAADKAAPSQKPAAGSPPAPARGKDRFGAILGKQYATFNAALTTKPSTIREIVDRSDLVDKVHINWGPHLRTLAEKGFVEIHGEGKDARYALKKNA